jgi:dihydrofolate reductase
MIAAMSRNRCIGRDNGLPWHLPADLQHFKALTSGHYVIMGRRTFESIGRALPNRSSVVVSRNPDYPAQGCFVVPSIPDALFMAQRARETEVFVIGGGQLYAAMLPLVTRIYLTEVEADIDGDAFFPELSPRWREVSRESFPADERHAYPYSFVTLQLTD